jgi:hypothetical protein
MVGVPAMRALLDFLARLDAAGTPYRLTHKAAEQLTVEVEIPGSWWEFHFGVDGFEDAEVYTSSGTIPDRRAFDQFWEANRAAE